MSVGLFEASFGTEKPTSGDGFQKSNHVRRALGFFIPRSRHRPFSLRTLIGIGSAKLAFSNAWAKSEESETILWQESWIDYFNSQLFVTYILHTWSESLAFLYFCHFVHFVSWWMQINGTTEQIEAAGKLWTWDWRARTWPLWPCQGCKIDKQGDEGHSVQH